LCVFAAYLAAHLYHRKWNKAPLNQLPCFHGSQDLVNVKEKEDYAFVAPLSAPLPPYFIEHGFYRTNLILQYATMKPFLSSVFSSNLGPRF
jgi:hypothetical protein